MTPSRPMRFLAWLTLVSFFSSTVSAAVVDISSVPLVSMSTKVVRPNVMFILDDSGSMNDDFMPDDIEVNSDKNCFRNFRIQQDLSSIRTRCTSRPRMPTARTCRMRPSPPR
jgi:hypothetical protein